MDLLGRDATGSPDRRARFYFMIWFLVAIMITVVSLRMYVRIAIRKALGWDDFFICLALCTHILDAVFVTIALHYGVMKHIDELQLPDLLQIVKWFTATEIVAIATPVLVKLSVCISILRIVDRVQRKVKITIYILLCVLVATGFGTFVAFLCQCIPLQKVWKPWIDGSCMDRTTTLNDLYYFYGSVCTVTDFICGIIPIYVLYSLQMDRTTKIAVSCLLGLVMLPGVCSILKTIDVVETLNPDVTWAISGETTWVVLEVSLGIILASLPMLYGTGVTVFQSLSSRFRTWSSKKRGIVSSSSEEVALRDKASSDYSSRAKSPLPAVLAGSRSNTPAPVISDRGEDLVVLKRENRIMRRREVAEYLERLNDGGDLEAGTLLQKLKSQGAVD